MKKIFASLMIAGLALSGCENIREKPVLNVTDSPFGAQTDQTDVEASILAALKLRRWDILDQQPGVITARHSKPNEKEGFVHSATIKVTYDANSFSIDYVDSENLMYREKSNTIHRNYNRWVSNLERDLAPLIVQ